MRGLPYIQETSRISGRTATVCGSWRKSVSTRDGWRKALDAAAQMVFLLPGRLQARRALGSVSRPLYALCSSLPPMVNHNESDRRISSCANPLYRLSDREGGENPTAYPGSIAELLTR